MNEQAQRAGSARGIVSAEHLHVLTETVRIGAPIAESIKGEPKVQLVREDGVIRAIDVTCSCGERIRIRCEYD